MKAIDPDGKCFIKDIGDNYHPYPGGCWVGGLRPYWTSYRNLHLHQPRPEDAGSTSRNGNCATSRDVVRKWTEMAFRMAEGKLPYDIDISKCWHCYYSNNNSFCTQVRTELPDKDFA